MDWVWHSALLSCSAICSGTLLVIIETSSRCERNVLSFLGFLCYAKYTQIEIHTGGGIIYPLSSQRGKKNDRHSAQTTWHTWPRENTQSQSFMSVFFPTPQKDNFNIGDCIYCKIFLFSMNLITVCSISILLRLCLLNCISVWLHY